MGQSYARLKSLLCFGLLVCVGTGIGWFSHAYLTSSSTPTILREPEGRYHFISPLIGFNIGEKNDFPEYIDLERTLEKNIDALVKKGTIHSASVYFRDLESGRWTGVNEDDLYSPASLYKVALLMATLRKAEVDPMFFKQKIRFMESLNTEKPDYTPMEIGKAYTIQELLARLIVISDNDAKNILHENVGSVAVSTVFSDLRLAEPALSETGDTMSARTYSRFFRALYNSTYLNRTNSEYALSLLSQVEFKSGIVNGLPEEARKFSVAHKFGYRVLANTTDTVSQEIHDCGIVYAPIHPYFVCIMTKGWNQYDLLDAIQLFSQKVYEGVKVIEKLPPTV